MKAPAFDYVKPKHLSDVFALFAKYGDEAKLLAGGQTLLATLNMRLSEPSLLIDISGIETMRGISVNGQMLRIGALTTHSEIESSAVIATNAPLLSKTAPSIAHRAIRNLGTIGGSVAYADPAAEWPTCVVALDAMIVVQGAAGERRIAAGDFFVDLYQTALQTGELVTAIEVPVKTALQWCDFAELSRRHGDYAIAGLAGCAHRSGNALSQVRLVLLGIGATPLRSTRAEAIVEGAPLTDALVEQACAALKAEIEPVADLTSNADTKRHLAGVLLKRMLTNAARGA